MKWTMKQLRRHHPSLSHQRQPKKSRPVVERLETRLAPANVPILKAHYDNLLSGWNNQETALTPANVNDAGFGRLFNSAVDGYTFAQPLYVNNLTVGGTPHTGVVFAATEHDSLYAFDGDTGALIWQRSFIDPANGITTMPSGETFSGDIVPEIGITGTPVIDSTTNTLYLVAKTKEIRTGDPNPHYVQKLYAINITSATGADRVAPVTIGDTTGDNANTSPISVPGSGAGSVGGVLTFNARKESNRGALQLVTNADNTKTLYIPYASHGDNGPYHGWVIGYGAANLALQKVYSTSPNGSASGIWQSGGGLGVDAQNNLYFATGNGFGTGYTGNSGPRALGAGGGALGYGGGGTAQEQRGVTNSVAVALRAFDHSSTSLLSTNATGTTTTVANFDLGGATGIDFNAGAQATPRHTFQVTLTYSGTTLTETIKDLTTGAMPAPFVYNNVDIAQLVGGNTAWVGFTGGTGGLNAQQDIQTWTFTPTTGTPINHSAGFASNSDLSANGNANFAGTVARITTAENGKAGSVFSNSQVNITGFNTTFTFQMSAGSNPIADGLTFTIQNKAQGTEFSESVLKLSTTAAGTALPVADFFTPNDWKGLDNADADLGSGGTMLLPDAVGSAAHPRLIIETGKTGRLYLMDRDHLGENVPVGNGDQILQTVTIGGPGVWGNASFLQDGPNTGLIYYWGTSSQGQAFRITNGVINPTSVKTNLTFQFPGAQPSISSNGTNGSTAIMWALRVDNFGQVGPETLLAYNAETLGNPIWTSNNVIGRDSTGTSVKFVFPIVTNGHVYVGSNGFLTGYGLLPAHATAPTAPASLQVTQVPPSQGGDTKLQLSWTNPDNNATLIKIERSTAGAGGPFTQIAQVGPVTTFTDTGLTPVTHYWYRIRATNQAGDSAYSNVGDAFTRLSAARASVTNVTSVEVDLAWTATGNNGYRVERSTDPAFGTFTVLATLPSNQTTYPDTTVMRPNTYYYRIHALNTNPTDESFSNVISAVVGPLQLNYPFPTGITTDTGLQENGSAIFGSQEHLFRLNNDFGQAGSVFTTNKVGVSKWTNTFWIRLHEGTQPNPADGLTFTLQANSPAALGGGGGALGYQGIGHSVAIKFDVFENEGETNNSTGIFFNGDFPGVPHAPGEVNVPLDANIVNLRDQHRKRIDMDYDLATLQLHVTITDEQHDGGPTSLSQTYNVNIPGVIGTDAAYVGFTGGTGGLFSLQDVLGWVFPPTPPGAPTTVQAAPASQASATVSWKPTTTDEDGFRIERSIDNFHFSQVGQVGFGVTTFTDTGLSPANYYYRVRAFNGVGASAPSASAQAAVGANRVAVEHATGFAVNNDLVKNGSANFVDPAPAQGTIGIFTAHQDIGTQGDPGTPGNATFTNGTYTLTASGSDIWDQNDHFHYLYKPMSGDGEIVARMASENSQDFWTKGGIMIRNSLASNAANAFMFETADGHNEPVFQWRNNDNDFSGDFGNHANNIQSPPVWLRLVRSGNDFSGFWAVDNGDGTHGSWQNIGLSNHTVGGMGQNVFVGLGLTSHNNGAIATATFDHVSVTTVARLTNGQNGQAASLWKSQQVPINGAFDTSFILNIRPRGGGDIADGATFALQNDPRGTGALGDAGGAVGYSGIQKSVAVLFDYWTGNSHHLSTKLLINGDTNRGGAIDLTTAAGLDPTLNHSFQVDLSYDSTTLTEKITDLVTKKSFTTTYAVNIQQIISGNNAYAGFTAGTGGQAATVDVDSWTANFNPFPPIPHLIASGFPSTVTAGHVNTFNLNVFLPDGTPFTGFRGTVHFSSPDPQAIVPDDYQFTAADAGRHTFGAVLFTAGIQSINVQDADPNSKIIPEAQAGINVIAGPASVFTLSSDNATPTAGSPFNVTVTAFDRYGNVATGYTDTVQLSSSDPKATVHVGDVDVLLPTNYTFTSADAGSHTFSITLRTAGSQSVTATDTVNGSLTATTTLTVLAAQASRIKLSAPSSAGVGEDFTLTVTAFDMFDNVANNPDLAYTGTVDFFSTDQFIRIFDQNGNRITSYTFSVADGGQASFDVQMFTEGGQAISAVDPDNQFSDTVFVTVTGGASAPGGGSGGAFIAPLAPTGAVSTVQPLNVGTANLRSSAGGLTTPLDRDGVRQLFTATDGNLHGQAPLAGFGVSSDVLRAGAPALDLGDWAGASPFGAVVDDLVQARIS